MRIPWRLRVILLGVCIGCSHTEQAPSERALPEASAGRSETASTAAPPVPSPAPSAEPAPEEKIAVTILRQGKGLPADIRDRVRILYVGTLADGTKFDSVLDKKHPLEFVLAYGQVLKGLEKGVLGMRVGEKRKVIVPPSLGYGAAGHPGVPPNSTLTFEIELVGNTFAQRND